MSEMVALDQREILLLLRDAAKSRRDHAMILLAYKHGLRASEVCGLRLADVDTENWAITIKRLKGSLKTTQDLLDVPGQPLLSERRVLRTWLAERESWGDASDYLFVSQKGGRLDRSAFYRLYAGHAANAGLPASKRHPHALKHSLGYFLVDAGAALPSIQRALGHKSLASTGLYLKATDAKANRAVAKAFANFRLAAGD
jgi:type 1 fimbriae regulatory protein FimB